MSGWYIDPKTGKKVTLKPGETFASLGLAAPSMSTTQAAPAGARILETGEGYLHTSFFDKLFSWAGKAAGAWARGGSSGSGGSGRPAAYQPPPYTSITRPPQFQIDVPGMVVKLDPKKNISSGGGAAGVGSVEAAGSSGLMPWAIGAAVLVLLAWGWKKA
jgi:hypothetical protein